MVETAIVLGIDACKDGWVGIALDRAGRFVAAYLASDIGLLAGEVVQEHPLEVVGVDMPIGLPDRGERQADALARRRIGGLSSSVFMVPTRAALAAELHAEASAINRPFDGGKGISIQAWGLRRKLLEVDAWVRSGPSLRVAEVHPEVSFAAMADSPLTTSKKSWDGIAVRHRLLAAAGIEVPDQLGSAGRAGPDDVLDAAAVAWSAHRIATGQAVSLPARPERFSDGLDAAIWF